MSEAVGARARSRTPRRWSLRRLALFTRFPSFRSLPTATGADDRTPLLDAEGTALSLADAARCYPALAADLEDLQAVVMPLFRECEAEALLEQNRYRRQHVMLIAGGLVTATFGAVQAAASSSVWPGIVVSVTAAATTAFASVGRQSGALDGYLTNRLRAERLRSTYFNHLATAAVDEDRSARRHGLRERATGIRYDGGGGA